jgi:hypothetical protein
VGGETAALDDQRDTRSTHDTQEEAIKQGQGLADEQNAELVVHAQDGSIREKDSQGTTPATFPATSTRERSAGHGGSDLSRSAARDGAS